jgi:hypothetical protein
MERGGSDRSKRRLALSAVATLGFERDILEKKPQDLEGVFLMGVDTVFVWSGN